MKIAILGTGMVGEALATKLISLGHSVCMGSRTSSNAKAVAWVASAGAAASTDTFHAAVASADLVFFCTKGEATLAVARDLGDTSLAGRVVVDVSNPLDFSRGMPPSLLLCNTNSLGEELQRLLPSARIVKTLNIVNCEVMVNPRLTGGRPTMLVCGNDPIAKQVVGEVLKDFGWDDVIDLGDIRAARGTEMLLPVWLSLLQTLGHARFGFSVVRGSS